MKWRFSKTISGKKLGHNAPFRVSDLADNRCKKLVLELFEDILVAIYSAKPEDDMGYVDTKMAVDKAVSDSFKNFYKKNFGKN